MCFNLFHFLNMSKDFILDNFSKIKNYAHKVENIFSIARR
jgi:hypothetical protein